MKRGLMVLVATLVLAGVAGAAVQQGDTELDLLGSFKALNGDAANNKDTYSIEVGLGYFVTDNVQVGVFAGGSWEEEDTDDGDDEIMKYNLGGSIKYHFMPTNQWVPYIGARIAYAYEETDPAVGEDDKFDGLEYGPVAGLRFELNANNDFFAEYRYVLYGQDLEDQNDEMHAVYFGIIHQFK